MQNNHHVIIFVFSLLTLFMSGCHYAYAQQLTWNDFVERYSDLQDDESQERNDEMFNDLYEIHINPLDINKASEEELSALPFLSRNQILDILYYRETNGALMSLGELFLITSLDKFTREAIMLFCYAGEKDKRAVTMADLLRFSKNELVARFDVPLYKRAGFNDYSDSILSRYPNRKYYGDRYYHSLRYSLTSRNILDIGFQTEKDPGEKAFDYISGYAMLRNIGHMKKIIVGNYKANFGQGLVINTGTSFGKQMMMTNIGKMDKGFSKHSSTSEYGYLSGAAASISFKRFTLSPFLSFRKEDGTYNSDSTGLSSLKRDGYHRTMLERSKKGNTGIWNYGGNIHWDADNIQLSATVVGTGMSVPLKPAHDTRSTRYRLYNAQGDCFMAYSLAYSYRSHGIAFAGETASCNTGGLATINSLQWNMNDFNSIAVIQRLYSYRYVSVNGRSFGENSTPQNEDGLYIGWSSTLSRHLKFTSYIDGMYFPWLKSNTSRSSYGIESGALIDYSPDSRNTFSVNYRIKSKQKDYTYVKPSQQSGSTQSDSIRYMLYNTRQQLRISYSYSANRNLTLHSVITAIRTDFGIDTKPDYGISISGSAQWKDEQSHMRFNITASYFYTDSYDSRIYTYEPSLLYSMGSTSFYYKGFRIAGIASIPLADRLYLTAKIGWTNYLNRDYISSGTNLINTNHKEDIQLQVRWVF